MGSQDVNQKTTSSFYDDLVKKHISPLTPIDLLYITVFLGDWVWVYDV
jgi:hypothetical protein